MPAYIVGWGKTQGFYYKEHSNRSQLDNNNYKYPNINMYFASTT